MNVIAGSDGAVGGPRISSDDIYVRFADDEIQECEDGCQTLGAEPSYADSFHTSSGNGNLVFDRAGDVFVRSGGSVAPILRSEDVAETRTNPVVASLAGTSVGAIAYRYELGVFVGALGGATSCLLADGIPIDIGVHVDMVDMTARAHVLMGNVDETALAVRSMLVPRGLGYDLDAVVVKENGNSIDSGAIAVDEDGVVAVVWSREDPIRESGASWVAF